MILKLTKIDYDANLGASSAIKVYGERQDGTEWSRAFFADNTKVAKELADFGVGEWVNVMLKKSAKNPNWYDITGFAEVKDYDRAKEANKPTTTYAPKATGPKMGKSSMLSKEEWAEKDRVTNIRISKAVALKAAVDAGKTTPKAAMEWAEKVIPWLLDVGDNEKADDSDPLDPPA